MPGLVTKEFKAAFRKFLPKLRDAKEKNLNEADTRMRVRLLFSDVLGFDLLEDITQEHMVSGHYVDLTVKNKGKIVLFIEAKSVDTTLRDTHAYQVTNYAATGGVNLCLLTNGIDYRLYHLTWDKAKVESSQILNFNAIDDDINEVCKKIYLLSKESFKKGIIEKFVTEIVSLDAKNLLQAMLSPKALATIRRELKNITGHNIQEEAVERSIAGLFNADIYEIAKTCLRKQELKEKKTGGPKKTVTIVPERPSTPKPSSETPGFEERGG